MILVDSSVWIDSHRKKLTPEVEFLLSLQSNSTSEICLSHIVYFEVLRGISNDLERKRAQRVLDEFKIYDYKNEGFTALITQYQLCQKKGLTLPRLGDWLILKTVIDHSLKLLTSDNDFHKINAICPFDLIKL